MDKNVSDITPGISIIIPVYNVGKYLARCLDSIFNQYFSEGFEIIAVDDCSTDNSLAILKAYQKHESRLTVIKHPANLKQSVARNTGMIAARGDYIMHVDADDWLLPSALKNIYKKCKETDADVLVFNYVQENNLGKRITVNNITKEVVTTDKQEIQHLFLGASWNKIVKRCYTENMISGAVGLNTTEDLLYSSEILLRVKTICLFPEAYYAYFYNVESITSIISPVQYLHNQKLVLNQIQEIVFTYSPDSQFIDNVLNHFERYIYLEIAKIHFWNKRELITCQELLKDFEQVKIMPQNRLLNLSLAIKNKWTSIKEVNSRFGYKQSLSIFLRSFIK